MTRPRLRKRSEGADGSENVGLSGTSETIELPKPATTETANEETNSLNGDAMATLSFPLNNRGDLEFCSRCERNGKRDGDNVCYRRRDRCCYERA